MKKKMKFLLIALFLFCALKMPVSAADTDKPKIIYFILDDSGSMIENTSRWIEADYAIKALITTMNEEDRFCILTMGQYLNKVHAEESKEDLELESVGADAGWFETYFEENKKLAYTTYAGHTCKLALDVVQNDITEKVHTYPEDQYDYWIIWITDGEIDCDQCVEGKGVDKILINRSRLEEWKGTCAASLIHISINDTTGVETETTSNGVNGIWRFSTRDGVPGAILNAVTEAGNTVYHRMRYTEADDMVVIDIPVKHLLVLEQFEGEKQTIESDGKDKNDDLVKMMNELMEQIPDKTVAIENEANGMEAGEVISFSGRTSAPRTSGNNFVGKFGYQALMGRIYSYDRKYEKGGGQNELTKLSLSGSNTHNEVDYEVYYEPDLNINPVFHLDDGEFQADPENNFILEEGEGTVEIVLEDAQGKEFNDKSQLLKLDEFTVEITAGEEKTELISENSGELIFRFPELSIGEYGLCVKSSWGEIWEYKLSVTEKKLPIEIKRVNAEEFADPVKESTISFSVKEKGGDSERNSLIEVKAIVGTDPESAKWNYELRKDSDDGTIWHLKMKWKDPKDHVCAESLKVKISACRNYEDGYRETKEEEFEIKIQASPEAVAAKFESIDDTYFYPWNIKEILDEVTYECGTELTDKQRAMVSGTIYEGEDSERFSFEKDRLTLGPYQKWIFWKAHEAEISGKLYYTKWNRKNEGEWRFRINIRPIPAWLVIAAGLTVLLLLGVILYMLFKPLLNRKYIPARVKFTLKYEGNAVLQLKPGWIELLIARISLCRGWKEYKLEKGKGYARFDDIKVKMSRGKEPDTWIVENREGCSENCEIGGRKISENNFVISKQKPFTVIDKKGYIWTLTWNM